MSAEEALFQRFAQNCVKGTVLFREGEPGKDVYVLQSGRVSITKKVGDVETLLATLNTGEFFGEMAIVSNKPRNATATVLEDSKLLAIDPKTFEDMVRSNAEIALRMIKKLAERLAHADEQIETLLFMDPARRIVHRLLQICQNRGHPTEEGVEIDFSPREQPTTIGVGEPAIHWVLNRLERSGIIDRSGDRITIRDPAQLQNYLEYLHLQWKFGEI